MLTERQRLLLTMLDALRDPVGNTDFQKLLFLYTRECEESPSYEFVPYKFGAFCFTSYADKRKLIAEGLLANDEHNWMLTPAGIQTARRRAVLPLVVGRFCKERAKLRGNALIAEQYRKHPYYATRSEIVEKLRLEPEALKRIVEAQPKKAQPGLATIGYEGKTLERYLNQLLQAGVTLLCDVRRNPLSRKYGFSKSTLSNACDGVGIRYEHLPELGIASEERQELVTQADYDTLFETYERDCLPKQHVALNIIKGWIEAGERVALTCYEALPCQCHRHCVADALRKSGRRKLLVSHL